MQGIEALGRTDVIVVDKTGTLTRNEMIVSKVITPDHDWRVTGQGYHIEGEFYKDDEKVEEISQESYLMEIGAASSLLNTAEIEYDEEFDTFRIIGDPTEAAMYILSEKLGFELKNLKKKYKKIHEIPFDSDIKYHAGFYDHNGNGIAFIVGSPELIFERSKNLSQDLEGRMSSLLEEGLRIVGVAKKSFDLSQIREDMDDATAKSMLEGDLEFLGLCGIQDSIRPEIKEVVENTRDAGLHVIMATGDHKKTAVYIARQTGILHEDDQVIEGYEFDELDDQALKDRLNEITVYARFSPQQKVRIIDLFHDKDKIIAMTGDGVNDAPSLIAADLGIAMGGIGTEVAKQASDLILLDDSFVNIVRAIEQGRHIFYTLRRVILYFFATNMGEILIIFFSLIMNMPLPLRAVQILWLNFVTDGFLDTGLSMEPMEPGLLKSNWLKKHLRLVDWQMFAKMFFMAIPMGIGSLWVFSWYYAGNPENLKYARTMCLMAMAMYQWFNAWNCRSERYSLFEIGLFSNFWLVLATLLVLSLQFLLIYVGFMQEIFKTVALSWRDWMIIIAITFPIIILEEIRKLIVRRFFSSAVD